MKKTPTIEPVEKVVLFLSDDNAVEMYSLARAGITETYLRRGNSVEVVEGEVSLDWAPQKADYGLYLNTSTQGTWSQANGLQTKQILKHFQR